MRVAVLGVGGLGRTLASELRTDPRVTALLLADQKGERARILTAIRGRVTIEARQLNVENASALVRSIRGYDVVVNTTLPRYNLTVMEAALEAGTNYLDISATGPRVPGGKPGILEQLDLDDRFRSAGRTALLSMGMDPGMSSVLAKAAAKTLDTVDAVRIRTASTGADSKIQTFPLYSRETFLEDVLVKPTVWADGALQERDALGEEETFAFPAPVGPQRAYLVSHEETKTIPRFLGKAVGRVDYKVALNPDTVRALLALDRLGLLSENRTIRAGEALVPFRRALLAAFPERSAVLQPLEGNEALAVEAEGSRGGQRIVRRADILLSNQEANRRRSTNAVHYLTSVGAALGLAQMDEKAIGPGVVSAEALDPVRALADWTARKLPLEWSERAVG